MSLEVRAATPQELGYVMARAGVRLTSDARGIVAVDERGVRGGVAYDNWTENACQLHVAVEAPSVFRRLLRPMFQYPFETRGVLWSLIVESNRASRKMARHVGFRETHRIADGFAPGVDLVCVEMRREECRWVS